MPRPKRICIPGLPHHVVQRGNDRQATFCHDEDYDVYLEYLAKAALKHTTRIHAYALMTNHVHLLLTPTSTDGLSLTMQALGRRYVAYINATYQRTGTLWEGRFKAAVVDTDRYCLTCYRYIDLNPVRAAIVADPAEYCWTSYRSNALAVNDELLTPHTAYVELGRSPAMRARHYRKLIEEALQPDELHAIRYGTRKGLPVGSARFRSDIEIHLQRKLGDGRVGRPRKR